jgi:hypothetical protein
MEARLTEFSYGYCVTEELANGMGPGLKAAPYFPSLYAEGKEGGGFDVQIGTALFLQFKLSEELTRRSATETKRGLLDPTFFRFWLHRRDRSAQHKMLIELESKGHQVYYIAPEFADLKSLDDAYNSPGGVLARSVMFSPTDIGLLPDDRYHSLAFRPGGTFGWFLSDPKRVMVARASEMLQRALRDSATAKLQPTNASSAQQWFISLGAQIRQVIEHNRGEITSRINRVDRGPLEEAAYLARTHFGCELFLFAERSTK